VLAGEERRRIYGPGTVPIHVPNVQPSTLAGRGRRNDRFGLACLLGWPVANDFSEDPNMVVIRLARGGAKKRPFYNIVVADSRERRDGRYLERVGFYNPMAAGGEQPLRVAMDRVTYWKGVGAQLSPTVKRLVADAAKAQTTSAPAAA
jgi:small subunit ribosomal protein S16